MPDHVDSDDERFSANLREHLDRAARRDLRPHLQELGRTIERGDPREQAKNIIGTFERGDISQKGKTRFICGGNPRLIKADVVDLVMRAIEQTLPDAKITLNNRRMPMSMTVETNKTKFPKEQIEAKADNLPMRRPGAVNQIG